MYLNAINLTNSMYDRRTGYYTSSYTEMDTKKRPYFFYQFRSKRNDLDINFNVHLTQNKIALKTPICYYVNY